MCGIFGQISKTKINKRNFKQLVSHSEQRGIDSSGLIYFKKDKYRVFRADYNIKKLLKSSNLFNSQIALGHSRLITNGIKDNQPVIRNNICLIHNGIIVNEELIWNKLQTKRMYQIDSEVILAITEEYLQKFDDLSNLQNQILSTCKGVIACAILFPQKGKLLLFSNNGSLYVGYIGSDLYFASESYGLNFIGCKDINKIKDNSLIIDIPISEDNFIISDEHIRNENLLPQFHFNKIEESLLEFSPPNLKRCTKCILPETMPFISFNEDEICNYCTNYKKCNNPKPKEDLFKLVEKYRKNKDLIDCIIPFSGGRDSCYALHLVVNELKMEPVTYTYDWGMVTDLGRRNISRMCSQLGVENIIVAADISKKRRNIRMNLIAWLKSPHLGMIAMLTAGDKHFFRYVESIKKQTEVNLNLWGINPLEQTHFKTGFLGIKPDFAENKVYSNGIIKQFNYHFKRFGAMLQSPGYFNRSLWDTISGEYYRSFTKKKDYYHIFDYWRWDEEVVNQILIDDYEWEIAKDTNTTWRIGDGTAGLYNYIYFTVAGFTEHDTFRSNQIREGQITRKKALELVALENQPRYENIKWYLDTLSLDFNKVIKIINSIPKLYPL